MSAATFLEWAPASLENELMEAASLLEFPELEVTKRQGAATVNWAGPFTVNQAIQAGRGKKGLYVIYLSGQVVDSGKSEGQDLATRLAQHFEYPNRHGENLNRYRIRLGFIRTRSAVNLAEGTVTRSLAKKGEIPLRRRSLKTGRQERVPNTAQFRTGAAGVRITHTGKLPAALKSFTRVKGGRAVQRIRGRGTFEFLPPYLHNETELEQELEFASHELEADQGESFYTRVQPVPHLPGYEEGHEVLTRNAALGLISGTDLNSVILGVIRPDRGGASYWSFPRAALHSFDAAAQKSHSLRASSGTAQATALGEIRQHLARLYSLATAAPNRTLAMEWVGEALHLIQDSYSDAHVSRALGGGSGGRSPIRFIRAFYINTWPPSRSTGPGEHNVPSDSRDSIWASPSVLGTQATYAVQASRDYLAMLLRHLASPGLPANAAEFTNYLNWHFST
jgi:hypothetical protein